MMYSLFFPQHNCRLGLLIEVISLHCFTKLIICALGVIFKIAKMNNQLIKGYNMTLER